MRKYSTKNSKKAERIRWKRMFLSSTFRVVLIVLLLLFTTIYIVETSSTATSGYQISQLKQKIEKLENKNERLDVRIAQKRSLRNVTKRIDKEEFVPIKNIDYGTLQGTAVVKK
ncbi:MAG: hypothetical protein ABEJ02_00505 [Candidatus Paceibacteria bacterium]